MAQFDVYEPRKGAFLLDVQSDWLLVRASRVVIPLHAAGSLPPIMHLTPAVSIDGSAYIVVTHQLFTIRARGLGRPVANLAAYRDDIVRALDFLITGF